MKEGFPEKRMGWFLKGPRGSKEYKSYSLVRLKEKADLSLKDENTGIFNRRGIEEIFVKYLELLKRNNQLSLMIFMIDLDNFKIVNDKLGHHKGDELIKVLAENWQSCLRGEDVIGRFGGDEFLILAFSNNENALIERLEKSFDFSLRNLDFPSQIKVGFSAGSAKAGEGLDENGKLIEVDLDSTPPLVVYNLALRLADSRMYKSKRLKKG